MKKLVKYISRTIDDELVKDGLCAVSRLDDYNRSKKIYMVVGGISTQSYLPTMCRRPTADIDLAVGKPLNYNGFKEFSKPICEYMLEKGYEVSTKKGHNSYHIDITAKAGDSLLIEFSRRNEKKFKKFEKKMLRELENARNKRVEGREKSYYAASPEDIVIPKLARSINSLERNPNFKRELSKISEDFSQEKIRSYLEHIADLKEEAILNIGDLSIAERLRFISDLYDIRTLSEMVGFNETYFNEVSKDWDTLKKKGSIEVFSPIFPENLLNKI